MRIIVVGERGSWLATRLGSWGTVGAVAGTGFEAYARILHPIEAWRQDTSVEDDHGLHPVQNERWLWADVAGRLGKVTHPLVQYTALVDADTTAVFSDGWRVSHPATGWFEPDLLARLTPHLATAATTPNDLVAGVWNGWGQLNSPAGPFLRLPGRDYLLFATSADELADPAWVYGAGLGWGPNMPGVMPQLLWPKDHAWVIASEIDWDSTIVAGPRTLIDAVLSDDTFEAYEVSETADLSWDGDQINRRED